jgi:hypothetical protein
MVSGITRTSFGLLAHPATKVTSSNARNHIFENTLSLFIFAPSFGTFESVKLFVANLMANHVKGYYIYRAKELR